MSTADMLMDLGFEVTEASSAEDAHRDRMTASSAGANSRFPPFSAFRNVRFRAGDSPCSERKIGDSRVALGNPGVKWRRCADMDAAENYEWPLAI